MTFCTWCVMRLDPMGCGDMELDGSYGNGLNGARGIELDESGGKWHGFCAKFSFCLC